MTRIGIGVGVFVAAVLAAAVPVAAQVRVGGVFDVNFANASMNHAMIVGEATSYDEGFQVGAGTLIRFGIGGVLELRLKKRFSVVAEPMLLGKGARATKEGSGGFSITVTEKLSYLELPVLAKYGLGRAAALEPYLLAGPTVGFKTGAKGIFSSGVEGAKPDYEAPEEVRSMDFGLAVGCGLSKPFGSLRAFAEAQYVFGLVDVDAYPPKSNKNKGLQIRVGATVPIGSK
jgi:hypothetical protein